MDIDALVATTREALAARGDPERAREMAAYLKTDMPMFGVAAPERKGVYQELRAYAPADRQEWEAAIRALWALPEREGRYAAIAYARQHPAFHTPAALPLFEDLIREGGGWDLVDEIAVHLVGGAWRQDPPAVGAAMDRWIEGEDLWLRRSALLAQNTLGEDTDEERLFRYCAACAPDPAFFIRKAIGWALREYSKVHPVAVAAFLLEHREALSGLSFREGSKHLERAGIDLREL